MDDDDAQETKWYCIVLLVLKYVVERIWACEGSWNRSCLNVERLLLKQNEICNEVGRKRGTMPRRKNTCRQAKGKGRHGRESAQEAMVCNGCLVDVAHGGCMGFAGPRRRLGET